MTYEVFMRIGRAEVFENTIFNYLLLIFPIRSYSTPCSINGSFPFKMACFSWCFEFYLFLKKSQKHEGTSAVHFSSDQSTVARHCTLRGATLGEEDIKPFLFPFTRVFLPIHIIITQSGELYNYINARGLRNKIFNSRQPKFGKALACSVSVKIKSAYFCRILPLSNSF